MNELIGRVLEFETRVFPDQSALYSKLVHDGQSPKALMISCADSRVVPENIVQAEPGELFVCRNAGNIVPPYAQANGGVTSTVEYAVMALGVRDIIVCGHSDCGAMKGLCNEEATAKAMPNVAAWLKHAHAALQVVNHGCPDLNETERVRAVTFENIVAQLANLRTHPAVAAGIARGDIALHGWFFDMSNGTILALDGTTNRFVPLSGTGPVPVALPHGERLAYEALLEAAE